MKHLIRNAAVSIALVTASSLTCADELNDAAIFSIFDQAYMAGITSACIGVEKASSKVSLPPLVPAFDRHACCSASLHSMNGGMP